MRYRNITIYCKFLDNTLYKNTVVQLLVPYHILDFSIDTYIEYLIGSLLCSWPKSLVIELPMPLLQQLCHRHPWERANGPEYSMTTWRLSDLMWFKVYSVEETDECNQRHSGSRKSTSASHYIFFAVQTTLLPHKDNSCIVLTSTLLQATFKINLLDRMSLFQSHIMGIFVKDWLNMHVWVISRFYNVSCYD